MHWRYIGESFKISAQMTWVTIDIGEIYKISRIFSMNIDDIFKNMYLNSLCLKTYDYTPKLWQ